MVFVPSGIISGIHRCTRQMSYSIAAPPEIFFIQMVSNDTAIQSDTREVIGLRHGHSSAPRPHGNVLPGD